MLGRHPNLRPCELFARISLSFSLFNWITTSVREAVLAGFRQAVEIVKSGQAGDSQEAKLLLALTAGQESQEPGQIEAGTGKRGKAKA